MKNLLLIFMRTRLMTRLLIIVPLTVVILFNVHLITEFTDAPEKIKSSDSKLLSKVVFQQSAQLKDPGKQFTVRKHFNETEQHLKTVEIPDFEAELKDLTKKDIRDLILESNNHQIFRNENFILDLLAQEELIGESRNQTDQPGLKKPFYQTPKFLVIIIQVHSRLNYLEALIESLRNTKYIEQTLVVFSHDLYIPSMNDLIKRIDFCATLQIFYPLSLQIFPNEFPGDDPNDCPKSMKKADALVKKCNNAANPDSYGHYREPKIVQIKHHWFWKLSFIFEHLNATKSLKNLNMLLLEEDYYLMPDSIDVLRKLTEKILSDIDVVSLAVFERSRQNLEFGNLHKYSKAIWHSNSHNTGLLLGRAQWQMIKDCLNAFCTYDDYNWDWTLQHISHTCFKLPLVSIFPVSSRVIHIGDCGIHHKSKTCDPSDKIKKLKDIYDQKQADFFQKEFILNNVSTGIRRAKKSNGGWSDPRDHQLCKSFVYSNVMTNESDFNSSSIRQPPAQRESSLS